MVTLAPRPDGDGTARQLAGFLLATLAVAGLFGRQVSWLHLTAVAGFAVAAVVLALVPSARRVEGNEWEGSRAGTTFGPVVWLLLVLAAGKYLVVWWFGRSFLPALHDEWSYLFGAKTLARGRLTAPAPPEPEAFQAIHVLVENGRWMSRYPPGHAAFLALGELFGAAWLVPVANALACMLIASRWAARRFGRRAALWTAALLAASPGLDYAATSYLSQSSWLLWSLVLVVLAVEAVLSDRPQYSALAAIAGGIAFLIRPYPAVLIGTGLLTWAIARCLRHYGVGRLLRHVAAVFPAVIATAAVWIGYNYATVGGILTGPWTRYNERFEPYNRLGVGVLALPRTEPASDDPRLVSKAAEIRRQRTAFTWWAAVRRSFLEGGRVRDYLLAFAPLVATGGLLGVALACMAERHALLLASLVAIHYVGYGFFYSTWGAYATEASLLLALLATAGAVGWDERMRRYRPLAALLVPLLLAANLAAAAATLEGFVVRRHRETAYARYYARLAERIPEKPALVFVRLDPDRAHPYDPINNDPWLENDVLFVVDRGPRANARLYAEHFRDRTAYLYDEASGRLVKLIRGRP